jgi:anti-anti-sigma factor
MDRIVVGLASPDVAVIGLHGEHDEFSAPKLSRAILDALGTGASVVIDLTDATFLDSTTVSALLRGRNAAAQRGLDFSVVLDHQAGWSVRHLFELTRLADVLPVVPRLEDALARARNGFRGRERRSFVDRRSGSDRRSAARPGGDRRSGLDRRAS